LKLALLPGQLVTLSGPLDTARFSLTVKLALLVTGLPHIPLTTTL